MITLTPEISTTPLARTDSGGPVAEQYYSLVQWLRAVGNMSGVTPKSVGITSCTVGAGVSTVAANLALAAARTTDQQVLFLDLSTTQSAVATRFAMHGDLGLGDAVNDPANARDFVKPSPISNLSVLAANLPGRQQPLNVDSAKINQLLQSLESEFSLIVVDLPTIESSLCFVASGLLNGVLLVMEAERTRSEIAARAKQRLLDAGASILGVILNKHPQHLPNWLEARI